jgi:hypothetical protein
VTVWWRYVVLSSSELLAVWSVVSSTGMSGYRANRLGGSWHICFSHRHHVLPTSPERINSVAVPNARARNGGGDHGLAFGDLFEP